MEGYDEDGNWYRKPIGKVWAIRDQWTFGVRQYIDVLVNEYEDGTLLQGTEFCQEVLSGNPSAFCNECQIELSRSACKHYMKEKVKRCGRKAWYESKHYSHTLCEKHMAKELGINVEELPK